MTIIEKIKAEIERRLKEYWEICFHDTNSYNKDTNVKELKELLFFISTLESENPVLNDLEEAAVDIADVLLAKPKEYALSAKADYWNGAYDGVIAGAKWQQMQMMKKMVEGTAHPDDCEIWVNLVGYGYKFNDGDKVRIIVIPNTDKK